MDERKKQLFVGKFKKIMSDKKYNLPKKMELVRVLGKKLNITSEEKDMILAEAIMGGEMKDTKVKVPAKKVENKPAKKKTQLKMTIYVLNEKKKEWVKKTQKEIEDSIENAGQQMFDSMNNLLNNENYGYQGKFIKGCKWCTGSFVGEKEDYKVVYANGLSTEQINSDDFKKELLEHKISVSWRPLNEVNHGRKGFITIVCYGSRSYYKEREKAIAHFREGTRNSEGSEQERYYWIIGELMDGKTYIDEDNRRSS